MVVAAKPLRRKCGKSRALSSPGGRQGGTATHTYAWPLCIEEILVRDSSSRQDTSVDVQIRVTIPFQTALSSGAGVH